MAQNFLYGNDILHVLMTPDASENICQENAEVRLTQSSSNEIATAGGTNLLKPFLDQFPVTPTLASIDALIKALKIQTKVSRHSGGFRR